MKQLSPSKPAALPNFHKCLVEH